MFFFLAVPFLFGACDYGNAINEIYFLRPHFGHSGAFEKISKKPGVKYHLLKVNGSSHTCSYPFNFLAIQYIEKKPSSIEIQCNQFLCILTHIFSFPSSTMMSPHRHISK
jgi:hypothetical protein